MSQYISRHAIDPKSGQAMNTSELRENFLLDGLFVQGEVQVVYTHYDRMIIGGAVPLGSELTLPAVKSTGTANFLDRRELIAVNIGGAGQIRIGEEHFEIGHRDMIYIGLGESDVGFNSVSAESPAKFYLLSAPAHRKCPTQKISIDMAKRVDLGAQATSNERSIFQFTNGVETNQLVVGMTQLAPGSVWNTMPAHIHDRRMEVYLYFALSDDARVFHFMGEPSETRHIVMKNEEAVLSPPWSIHSGCGTANYTFIWAMAGDNIDYTDVDPVPVASLR